MDSKLFIFIAACLSTLLWTALPPMHTTLLLGVLTCICSVLRYWRLVAALLGITWMASVGHWQYSLQLPKAQFSSPVLVVGEVMSLNHVTNNVRFNLSVKKIDRQTLSVDRNMRLSWVKPQWSIKQGQTVQFLVKLKPPHGLANEAGFVYQQWLFSEGIAATGYIRESALNVLIDSDVSMRQALLDKLITFELKNIAWIAALSLGYRGFLQAADWQLLQSSGLAHLIAISGLHLALVVSLSYVIFAWLIGSIISRFNGLHRLNVHKIALLMSLFISLFYAALAGFALPTLRAWLMLLLVLVTYFSNINMSLRRLLLWAFVLIIVFFPLSLFGQSLWLSYAAVSIIAFVLWRWPTSREGGLLRTWSGGMLKIQFTLSLLMLAVVLSQFSLISLVAPVLNLIAVPVVTLLMVPLCLVALLFISIGPWATDWLLDITDLAFSFALAGLQHIVNWQYAALALPQIPLSACLCLMIGILAFMLPPTRFPKAWFCLLFVPALTALFPLSNQNWQVDVLDVGQGTSVLITRGRHAMLYDVGPAYATGFNMADSVILPVLQARGIAELELVIISHSDNDHAGSLPYLQRGMPIHQIIQSGDDCQLGKTLVWQGLHLDFMWPDRTKGYSSNDSSCVLRISDSVHSVLLPGDISKDIEARLVAEQGRALQSTLLVAPHHGSKSSSSREFVQGVNAQYVVFTQGFLNRWDFPRPEVVERYTATGAILFNSSDAGQVSLRFRYQDQQAPEVRTRRQSSRPYWYANFPK
jgi:competence protein ComEC